MTGLFVETDLLSHARNPLSVGVSEEQETTPLLGLGDDRVDVVRAKG